MPQTITADTLIIANAAQSSTAFGEVATASYTPTVQLEFNYAILSRLVTTNVDGSGTITQNNSKAIISSDTTTDSSAELLSKRTILHRSGQGAVFMGAGLFSPPVSTGTQLMGIGDQVDGYFFGYDGESFGILRRRSSYDDWTSQSEWNGDKMDGSGSSSILLDPSAGNVYKIQFQWLGFGVIYFYIVNPLTGRWIKVHTIQYPNSNTSPSVFNPFLPVYVYAKNGETATDVSVSVSSLSAGVEGIINPHASGILHGTSILIEGISAEVPVLSIKNAIEFNDIPNRVPVKILNITVAADGGKPLVTKLLLNATLVADGFVSHEVNESVISVDTSATSASYGEDLFVDVIGKNLSAQIDINALDIYLYPNDTLTIVCSSTGDNDPIVSISWMELF